MSGSDPSRPIEERLPWIRDRLRSASHLLVCVDFDGTLAPIVEEPSAATITPSNRSALSALVERPSITPAVVSGRALEDVRERVSLPIAYAGNHGLELSVDGDQAVHPVARKRTDAVARTCAVLETALDPIPGARVENKSVTATVHVRSTPPSARPAVRRIVDDAVDRFAEGSLETADGKAIVELIPPLEWEKGDAVTLLGEGVPDESFAVYVGDDRTDESAFEAVADRGIGVHVGGGASTAASAHVRSPTGVASLLHWLASAGEELLHAESARSGAGLSMATPS